MSSGSCIVYQYSPFGASILIPPFAHANENDSLNFSFTGLVICLILWSLTSPLVQGHLKWDTRPP